MPAPDISDTFPVYYYDRQHSVTMRVWQAKHRKWHFHQVSAADLYAEKLVCKKLFLSHAVVLRRRSLRRAHVDP